MLKLFIGYDPREAAAYHTLCHSITKRASGPVSITPLVQSALRAQGIYTRPVDTAASTEFSLTRFLVPYLSGYEGVSIFMDCDMIVKCDIYEVVADIHPEDWDFLRPVWCCQHDYTPKNATKMDGQVQAAYPRKNWSSFMVFNNARCQSLTPEYVNSVSPADLHRFKWMPDEQIGSLPLEYNWLVGEYPGNPDAKILHYTEGGPWMRDYQDCDHANDWRDEYREILPPWSFYQNNWQQTEVAA